MGLLAYFVARRAWFVKIRPYAVGGMVAVVMLSVAVLMSWGGSRAQETVNVQRWEDVPEMGDILSNDQATRLTAARKLVERVGVEVALEIVEHSPLPHTGEGHLAVHQIGFHAYKIYGPQALLHCKDYFLYACYHGAIIEAARDAGLETITAMADVCKASPGRYFQCAHAVGHSLLAMWNYDVPAALKDCDTVFEHETGFPDALSSCHNGAFMENLFGVHDWGAGKELSRDWLSDDPYFPCTAFEEKYQKGCWLNQAARIYSLVGGDIAKTRELCEKVGNPHYTMWCIDNVARQIHPLTNGSAEKVFELCQQVGPYWYEKCVVVNAGSYYSVGDPVAAITICQGWLSPAAKSECYQQVLGQLVPDLNLAVQEKVDLCRSMEVPFRDECSRRVRLWKT